MEGVCSSYHSSSYREKRGWKFCPWCGISLAVKHHCEHCGKDFISETAFHVHQQSAALYRNNPCPNQEGGRHIIHHLRHRGKMFCANCRIEYPIKKVYPKNSKEGPALYA